ncbi:MAG: peptide deformylase [Candidatus Omnitrophica bacterium]|nr:peptide deformylase [Candidatus Omnitrophota bacterium]
MPSPKLKVRLYPDPCLRIKSKTVKEIGPGERMLIEAMISAMHKEKGIGLAAPQVGINQRIFVADIGQGEHVFVNLQILQRSGEAVLEEGCLSIPGVNINVKRAFKIKVKYMDQFNNIHEETFEDLMARVILHENDHLDGKLIIDYASKEDIAKYDDKLKDLEKKFKK